MDNNTINLSDDSGSDGAYCPSIDDKKHLRASQSREFQTRHRKYAQKSPSQSQTQSQIIQSPSYTQSENSQQSESQTQYETQKTPSKDKDVHKDLHTESESLSPTVNRSQRAHKRDAKKRAIEKGKSLLNNQSQGVAEAGEPETKKLELKKVLFGNMLHKSQKLISMVRRSQKIDAVSVVPILHVKVATLQQQESICLSIILLCWIKKIYLDYKMRLDKVLRN